MDDRERWEQRYRQAEQPFYGREPSAFLVRSLALLPPPGECLDAAGGEGRNAAFLAGLGWDVTLVDVALPGVARARDLARAAGVRVRLAVGDLALSPLRPRAPAWDLILAINYHSRELVRTAAAALRPGGALVVEGFAREQLGRPSGGPRDPAQLWGPNELPGLAAGLRLVWYEDRLAEGDDNPGHRGPKWVVRLVARRPP